MELRQMELTDYDRIYALWCSTPGMGLNDLDDSREGISFYRNRNPHTCFVATEAGQLVGVILAGHDGRRGYIHHLAVAVAFQRQGVGSALLQAALDALQAEGIRKAALVVFARNEKGNRFWEKQGFSVRDDLLYRNRALVPLKRLDT